MEQKEHKDNYSYSGQAQQSELINRRKAYREDDIYEGGDEEAGQKNFNTETALYKSGEELLNIDDEDKLENFY